MKPRNSASSGLEGTHGSVPAALFALADRGLEAQHPTLVLFKFRKLHVSLYFVLLVCETLRSHFIKEVFLAECWCLLLSLGSLFL